MRTKHSLIFIWASWLGVMSILFGAIIAIYQWHYTEFHTVEAANREFKLAHIRELERDIKQIEGELKVFETLLKQGYTLEIAEEREYLELQQVKIRLTDELAKAKR